MQKVLLISIAFIFFLNPLNSLAFQEIPDLTGTWIGPSTIENEPGGRNDLTLVLRIQEETLTGYMSDEFGYINKSFVKNVKFEQEVFTFDVKVTNPEGKIVTFSFKMNIKNNSMEGSFHVKELNLNGNWSAMKQIDLTGTWVGPSVLDEDPTLTNELTLELEKKNGKLTGIMNDEYGVLVTVPAQKLKFDKGILHFEIKFHNSQGDEVTFAFKMKVKEKSMKGTINVNNYGNGGSWEAEKVK